MAVVATQAAAAAAAALLTITKAANQSKATATTKAAVEEGAGALPLKSSDWNCVQQCFMFMSLTSKTKKVYEMKVH